MIFKTIPAKVQQGERLRDQIYDFVRGEMRLGLLTPGERLKEVELAMRLGVSRTPVREALFQLARDGLLEERNQGYQLPEHSPQELADRIEVRMLLESHMARCIALEADAHQQAQLRDMLDREAALVDTNDSRQFLIANLQFKHTLFDICRNQVLVRSAKLHDDQFQFFRLKMFSFYHTRKTTVACQEDLLAAVAVRDADRAEQAIRALFDALAEFQHTHLENHDEIPTSLIRRTRVTSKSK